jgi:acetamidase/formamidase
MEGTLFRIGDGRAVQGEGEIAGTGIETSLDVEVTLRVAKGRKILWPRAIVPPMSLPSETTGPWTGPRSTPPPR